MSRTMVEAITTPTMTPTVTGKLSVPSSTRNTMVSGEPMTAAATEAMPTSISTCCWTTRLGTSSAEHLAEGGAEDAAQQQRGAEHAAAEAGAQRDRRGDQLGDQQHAQHPQGRIVVEQVLDRAMAAAQHLRHDERDRRSPACRRSPAAAIAASAGGAAGARPRSRIAWRGCCSPRRARPAGRTSGRTTAGSRRTARPRTARSDA